MSDKKRYAVHILPPAQFEIEEIAQLYRSLSGVDSARRITDAIFSALDQIAMFPRSGSPVRDAELRALGYRCVIAGKHIAIYRYIGEDVFVYHIFDGRSDYPALFRSELFS